MIHCDIAAAHYTRMWKNPLTSNMHTFLPLFEAILHFIEHIFTANLFLNVTDLPNIIC